MNDQTHSLESLRIDRSAAPRRGAGGLMIVVLLALLAGGAGGGWWWWQRPRAVPVKTAVAQARSAGADRTLLNASGYVTARRAATVSSKVTGKVVEVLVEEGMRVEAGQVVARLDATNAEKGLALAKAQLHVARKALGETEVQLDQSRLDLSRAERLLETRDVSESDVDKVRTESRSLEARLERQGAEVEVSRGRAAIAEQELDDTIIRAPFGGVVTTKDSQPGEMISPISAGGGFTRTGICTVVDMASLEIEVDVSESYINRVRPGMPVVATLDSYPSWKIPCQVIAIIPTADRIKATVKVRIGFDELDARVLPDMSAKVAFQSESAPGGREAEAPPGVSVPKPALRSDAGGDFVWVVRGDKLERRAVIVSERLADSVVLASGIGGGEVVVVEGPDHLTAETRILREEP